MEEADRLCERLAIVDHGKILTLDTPAALKKTLPGGEILDLWVRAPGSLAPRLATLEGVNRLEAVASDGPDRGAEDDGGERLRLFVDPKDGLLDRVLHAVREAGGDLQHVSLTAAQPRGRLHPPHREGASGMTAFLALLRRDLAGGGAATRAPAARHPHPAHPGGAGVRQPPAPPRPRGGQLRHGAHARPHVHHHDDGGGAGRSSCPCPATSSGTREIDERLLAPITSFGVALEKIVAGALHADLGRPRLPCPS